MHAPIYIRMYTVNSGRFNCLYIHKLPIHLHLQDFMFSFETFLWLVTVASQVLAQGWISKFLKFSTGIWIFILFNISAMYYSVRGAFQSASI